MSMADVQNAKAIPAQARFDLKPNAVPAKRTRLNIQPYQSPSDAITSNQLIQFYIPARRGTMYDPQTLYLKGTIGSVISGTDATAVTLNRNAFSIINRIQVYGQDSTLLEDIQNYNDLCHILQDIQMSREDKYGLTTMYGGNDDASKIDEGVSFTAGTAKLNTGTVDFCIPLVSAFGVLAEKYIPTGWLSSDLRIDLYTELPNVAFRDGANTAVASYKLSKLELVVDVLEFDGEGMSLISQFAPTSGAPLYLHATSWKNYTSTLSNTGGFYSTLLPHRSLSVKEVLCSAHPAVANRRDSFARVLPYGGSNLQAGLNIGGQKFPQKPIETVAELFAELQKSQHAFNQIAMNGSINRTEFAKYRADIVDEATSLTAKAVIGFDTEIYDKKGSTIINGQNWTGLNVFSEGYVAEDADGNELTTTLRVQHYVAHDIIFVVQDGIISSRY
jgi:hypothetical protein